MTLETVAQFINALGLRKWTTSLLYAALLAILVYEKAIQSPEFVELFKWLILAAFAGNVLEYYVRSLADKKAPLEAPKA